MLGQLDHTAVAEDVARVPSRLVAAVTKNRLGWARWRIVHQAEFQS